MRNIAHRGASAYAPENTAAAFDLAIAMGADAIETDIQVTRDGHLVLFHDETVDRTTDGRGPLADHTLESLQALDAGQWFSPGSAGEQVMTLDAAFARWAGRIPFVFEIKDPLAARPFSLWMREHETPDRFEVTSFSWPALLVSQKAYPAGRYGFLTPAWNAGLICRVRNRGFAQVCPHVRVLTAGLVSTAHEQGLVVRAWGVRAQEDVGLARESGADGVTCNWPDWISQTGTEEE